MARVRLDIPLHSPWRRVFDDAVAYRFMVGQSVQRIRRLYRVRRIDVEQALRRYSTRRTGR